MTLRALTYARHSSEKQAASVAQQLAAARAYAEAHGYTVAAEFADEARPGKTTIGRAGLEALLAHLGQRPRPADVVLIWDSSRLSRDQDDAAILRATIRKAGLRIEYTGDQTLNIAGKEQRIVEALADYRADVYRDDLARNVKRGMTATLARGGAWGRPPRGYDVERDENDIPRYTPNADLDRVREIWRLRLQGMTYAQIHARVRLCPSPRSYKLILSNPIYTGRAIWDGREYAMPVTAIVTPEEFARVQTMNAERIHPRRANSPYLLSGLLVCATCGRAMNGTNTHANGRDYRYYSCKRPFDRARACRMVTESAADSRVIAELLAYFTPAKFRRVYAEWRRRLEAERRGGSQAAERLQADLARVERAIVRLTAAIEQGGRLGSLLATLATREAERDDLRARLQAPPPARPPVVDIAALCDEIRHKLADGDRDERRAAVRALVISATYHTPEKISVEIVSPDALFGL